MKKFITLLGVLVLTCGFTATKPPLLFYDFLWMNHSETEAGRPQHYQIPDEDVKFIYHIESFKLNCAPCNANAKNVQKLAAIHAHEPNVQFLDMSGDSERNIKKWIVKHSPDYPVLKDLDGFANHIGVNLLPTSTLIDCNGKIVKQTIGVWSEKTYMDFAGEIENLLQGICKP